MFVYLSILLAVATIQILIEYFILFLSFCRKCTISISSCVSEYIFFLFLFMFRESDSVERTIVGYLIHHLGIEIAYVF